MNRRTFLALAGGASIAVWTPQIVSARNRPTFPTTWRFLIQADPDDGYDPPEGTKRYELAFYLSENFLAEDGRVLVIWSLEMESVGRAKELFDESVDNANDDDTFTKSKTKVKKRTDELQLFDGELEDSGQPAVLLIAREHEFMFLWLLSGNDDPGEDLADLYTAFFRDQFDGDELIPDDEIIPEGLERFGE